MVFGLIRPKDVVDASMMDGFWSGAVCSFYLQAPTGSRFQSGVSLFIGFLSITPF